MEEKKDETLALIDIRKNVSVEDIKLSIKEMILGGKVDAAKAGVVIKKMAKVAEEILKDEKVKQTITDETQKYLPAGTKTVKIFGAKLTYAAVYTDYDFTESNHPVLNRLYSIKAEVEQRIKLIEEELKLLVNTSNKDITPNTGQQLTFGIKSSSKTVIIETMPNLVEEASGEIVEVKAPIKRQKMGIKYSEL